MCRLCPLIDTGLSVKVRCPNDGLAIELDELRHSAYGARGRFEGKASLGHVGTHLRAASSVDVQLVVFLVLRYEYHSAIVQLVAELESFGEAAFAP